MPFKRRWEQRPLPKGWATASAAQVGDTWACPTKRGKPATCSLQSYGWFTEVFETLSLKEAKAPLEELAS